MDRLSQRFPDGMRYDVPFNTTRFIEASINAVVTTFIEAIVLVVVVVFVFLQNWRATLIPVLAVPVSIVGAFAGMYLLGFSINLLTLFGLILAIGIVVDDAIIVLENVERIMSAEGKSPREAAIQAMQEVSGPVIAIVLVLCAVFIPVSFLGGLAGELYRQFAITIAVSVVISGIVALTLTPALCAILLKPGHSQPWLPFRVFNRGFDWVTRTLHGRRGLLPAPRAWSALVLIGAHARRHLVAVPARAGRPRAGRGSGRRFSRDDAAACRVTRPHDRDHREGDGRRDAEPGRRRRRHDSGFRAALRARRRPTQGFPSLP